jgi:hypothetical protein
LLEIVLIDHLFMSSSHLVSWKDRCADAKFPLAPDWRLHGKSIWNLRRRALCHHQLIAASVVTLALESGVAEASLVDQADALRPQWRSATRGPSVLGTSGRTGLQAGKSRRVLNLAVLGSGTTLIAAETVGRTPPNIDGRQKRSRKCVQA